MTAYYNEIDLFAAQWLRNLIAAGYIAPGVVDERSIEDIQPEELNEFTQCHFFAGIGGWSYALRSAGWPDDQPVWTGSCPCQPFSTAGKGAGFADERHLWPAFCHLIAHQKPSVVFGEQVASGDGRTWLGLVHSDLESLGYSFGAADLCAAGVGAPHIRQRLYWVADADLPIAQQFARQGAMPDQAARPGALGQSDGCGDFGRLAHADGERHGAGALRVEDGAKRTAAAGGADEGLRLPGVADPSIPRDPGPTNGHWRDADWLYCRDARWRPVEPGTFPLAHGVSSRVGRLRAYGNAIVPQVAEAFVRAYMDTKAYLEFMS